MESLPWLSVRFGNRNLLLLVVGRTFTGMGLEGALFWVLPFIFVTARTMGLLERLLFVDLTSTNAFSVGLLIAIVFAFVVARILRRATELKQ